MATPVPTAWLEFGGVSSPPVRVALKVLVVGALAVLTVLAGVVLKVVAPVLFPPPHDATEYVRQAISKCFGSHSRTEYFIRASSKKWKRKSCFLPH
jgi:hypothetical protein